MAVFHANHKITGIRPLLALAALGCAAAAVAVVRVRSHHKDWGD